MGGGGDGRGCSLYIFFWKFEKSNCCDSNTPLACSDTHLLATRLEHHSINKQCCFCTIIVTTKFYYATNITTYLEQKEGVNSAAEHVMPALARCIMPKQLFSRLEQYW